MSTIVKAAINLIDSNPFRMEKEYPFVARKIEQLKRNYSDVGMWEGVIARKVDNRYQIAFGHHRIEAARQAGMKTVSIIVRNLTDTEMLQFMGRENMEDFNSDFLAMLNTWEAAVKFGDPGRQKLQAVDIARLLGWTEIKYDSDAMNQTARACNAAFKLIQGGYLFRNDLTDLSVKQAREICGRAQGRMEQLDKVAKEQNTPNREIKKSKNAISKAAKETAEQSRKGEVATKELRAQVDANAYVAMTKNSQSPLFAVFGKALADNINRMLKSDSSADKLEHIAGVVDMVVMDDDKTVLRHIDFALAELSQRATSWRLRLTPTKNKVVSIAGEK